MSTKDVDGRDKPGHDGNGALARLLTAYGMIDREMAAATWAVGNAFSLADCAAAPALFYANEVMPFGAYSNVAAYFDRLRARPSYARVLRPNPISRCSRDSGDRHAMTSEIIVFGMSAPRR